MQEALTPVDILPTKTPLHPLKKKMKKERLVLEKPLQQDPP
jgi:hypothetical protein